MLSRGGHPLSSLAIFVALVVLAILLAVLVVSAQRARLIFRIRRERGTTTAEGRIPPRLLGDLREALEVAGGGPVVVSCYRSGEGVELAIRGELHPDRQQILRNLVGMWPVVRLMTAPRLSPRSRR